MGTKKAITMHVGEVKTAKTADELLKIEKDLDGMSQLLIYYVVVSHETNESYEGPTAYERAKDELTDAVERIIRIAHASD